MFVVVVKVQLIWSANSSVPMDSRRGWAHRKKISPQTQPVAGDLQAAQGCQRRRKQIQSAENPVMGDFPPFTAAFMITLKFVRWKSSIHESE